MHAEHLPLNRRQFLQRLGIAVGTASVTSLSGGLEAFAAPQRRLRVVIVGAGLAGLCAAYELEQRGHDVVLLEAEKSHVGGRVRTLRFEAGLYGELGAMRIPASHHVTRRYIRQFGLQLRPFVQYDPEAYYYVHGERKRLKQIPHLNTLYTYGMDGQHGSVWAEHFDEIVGGMDLLPSAFATHLASKPRFGCHVLRLEQDAANGKAAAIYRERGRNESTDSAPKRAEGDFLLCTLPLPVLRRLEVEPAFSAAKQRAIRELPYQAANKVLVVTERRFWEAEDHIFGGGTYTDLPTGLTYYPSDNAQNRAAQVSAGPGVLLASYTIGKPAHHLAQMPPGTRSASALRYLARVHPQLSQSDMVRTTESWSWDHYAWSGGGFAAPVRRDDLQRHLMAPDGRIFLAGEHISNFHSWMQGALESGLRAVRAILTAGSALL